MSKKILTIEILALLILVGIGIYFWYFRQQVKLIPPNPPIEATGEAESVLLPTDPLP